MAEGSTSFEEFYSSEMSSELRELAAAFPTKRSLSIDFQKLAKYDPTLADSLVESPDAVIKAAETALRKLEHPTVSGKKFEPHVRFYNLPDEHAVDVQHLGAEHLNKLARVDGVVSWVTEIKPLMKTAVWQCLHCANTIKTLTEKNTVRPPGICKCGHRDFKLMEESSEFLNVQRSNMQESVEKLRGSAPASHIELWMEDDLTNYITPGEKLSVSGILRLRQIKDGKTRSSIYAKFLDVVHLQKREQEFEDIAISKDEEQEFIELAKNPALYELISKSIAPSIYGYDEMKSAIAMQLFGGTPNKVMPDEEKIRSDLHVLLIGDPGTAKSSILEYVSRLSPKSVFVSGGGASGVGLTASAERDSEGEGWILKAGAMVLASGGLAVIDEFDKMGEEDRAAIHGAMEQQFISIAKAGIVTQFQTRTSVLAAANPKFGRFDPTQSPAQQFNLSPALISRFDLIFPIRDILDETRDKKMAEHILLGHRIASEKTSVEKDSPIMPAIEMEKLRKYIAYARKSCFPILTDEAMSKIKEFYIELRKLGAKQNNYPITARQIEGIIRLAESSAKMRLSPRVHALDADRAIAMTNFVLNEVFIDKETGRIDSDVINIGQPKSKLDKTRSIISLISALEKKVDLLAIDDVVKEATAMGIDEHTTRQIIDILKRQGDLYEPKAGHIKSARRKEW